MDPTAAVSPDRIDLGMDAALPPRSGAIIALGIERGAPLYSLLRRLRFSWDAANNWWNQWVLGYGPSRQKNLLANIGIDARNWRHISTAILALCIPPLFVVAIWLSRRARIRPDPARILYDRFCRKLARRGVRRAQSEGPVYFARRAGARLPALRAQIMQITQIYLLLRYSPMRGDRRELKRLIKVFPAQELP